MDFFDRVSEIPKERLAFRGDSLLSFKGANDVLLDGVEIRGALQGLDCTLSIENCEDIVKRNTNF